MQEHFQLLNQYYDKVYVLSVASAHARRELFANRFNGLDYSFFFGADKNEFTIEEIEAGGTFSGELAKRHHRYGKPMKHGEIACSRSHRMIYEDMLKNNYNRVLIFEDDAVPDGQRIKEIAAILNEIPPDCELLMWGWGKNGENTLGARLKKTIYHLQHVLGFLKWDHRTIRNLQARPFSRHLKKAGFHDYTYAYALSKSAAGKLVRMQRPIQYIADNLLAYAATGGIVKAYITWPAVFLHDNLPDGTHRDSYIR